jgi:hypothetical protein
MGLVRFCATGGRAPFPGPIRPPRPVRWRSDRPVAHAGDELNAALEVCSRAVDLSVVIDDVLPEAFRG